MQNSPMVALIQRDWKWNSSIWTQITGHIKSRLSQDAGSWWSLQSDIINLIIQTEKIQTNKAGYDKGTAKGAHNSKSGSNSDSTVATISLRRQSSISSEELYLEIHIDSEKVSDHWQLPLRTTTLLDFAIVLPFSTDTTETNSLSHPLGTC